MTPLNLTRWQRLRLQRQLRDTSDARVYRRTLAVLEASRGQSVVQIAQTLGVTRQSVYNWIEAYTAAWDPDALVDADRSGRPSCWTEDLRGLLRSLFAQAPDQLGYFAVNWTVPLLQEHLQHQTGHWLAEDTIRRELDRLGYVWKRSRYILDPDPQREKKTAPASGDPRNPGN
jgi:transposase